MESNSAETILFGYNPKRKACTLYTELERHHSQESVFPFFADASNLEKLTPGFLNFEILTPAPIEMTAGTLIDYRIKLHGIPIKWRTRIRDWDPPHRFVDEQLRGPYLLWEHEHRFEKISDTKTLLIDQVHYKVPFGRIIDKLLVRRDLQRIFEFRRQAMISAFPE